MKNLYNKDHYVRIIYRFQKLKPEATALWGKMSVNQMLRHCADLLRIVNNPDRKDYPSNLFLKTIGRFVFLHTPLTWPKNLPTEPSINQAIVNSASNDFNEEKHNLLDQLKNFSALTKGYEFPNHPAFGNLTRKEWGRVMWLHLDHHLRQFGV